MGSSSGKPLSNLFSRESSSDKKSFDPIEGEGNYGELPPPAYAPTHSAQDPFAQATFAQATFAQVPVAAGTTSTNADDDDNDKFAFLRKFDTVFLIDDSASMNGPSSSSPLISRWDEVANLLRQVSPICTRYDADGIDVYFLNHTRPDRGIFSGAARHGYCNVRSPAEVTRLFRKAQPWNGTPMGERLQQILGDYMKLLEAEAASGQQGRIKPLNLIVMTDGEAGDNPDAVLRWIVHRLDKLNAPPAQVGVQFFQVGNDATARAALQALDDDLKSPDSGRDIVDAVTWDDSSMGSNTLTADGVLKVVLGAVLKKLDRKPMAGAQK